MKNLFCKRLAAFLRMKQSASESPSPKPRDVLFRNEWSIDSGVDGNEERGPALQPSSDTTALDSMQKQLQEIRDLLGTHVYKESDEGDRENEIKHDWMLAAAVLDRICAIAVAIFIVVGTIVLFVLFVKHP